LFTINTLMVWPAVAGSEVNPTAGAAELDEPVAALAPTADDDGAEGLEPTGAADGAEVGDWLAMGAGELAVLVWLVAAELAVEPVVAEFPHAATTANRTVVPAATAIFRFFWCMWRLSLRCYIRVGQTAGTEHCGTAIAADLPPKSRVCGESSA